MHLLGRESLHNHRQRLFRGFDRALHRAARVDDEHDMDIRFPGRLRHNLGHDRVCRVGQLTSEFPIANVFRDVTRALIFLLLDRVLPTLLDLPVLQQPEFLQRRSQDGQVLVGELVEHRDKDCRCEADFLWQHAHDLLPTELFSHDRFADFFLRFALEGQLPNLEIRQTNRAMAFGRLLLFPAKNFEEALGLRLVADHSRETLNRLGIARLLQAFQERNVRFAELQPVCHRIVVTADEWLALVRIAEAQRAVHRYDAWQPQYFAYALDQLGIHHAIGSAFVEFDHRFSNVAIIIVMEQNDLLAVLLFSDRFTRAALHQHERGANHFHVAPIRFLHDVRGEPRTEFVVSRPDIRQSPVDLFYGLDVRSRLTKFTAVNAAILFECFYLFARCRLPFSASHDARTVVPQMIREIDDQLHQSFGGSERFGDSARFLWRSSVHTSPPYRLLP